MTVASDLAIALDPALMMTRAGLPPDPWQADLLRSQAKQALLLCTRQAGKSTVTAALALHEAMYHAPSLVLLLSPSLRQSGELFRKVADYYRLFSGAAPADSETVLRLELTNGSRIISLPGKESTIRGYSGVSLLIVDEASRVSDDLYFSVRPMLAVSGGRLIGLSTPFGKRGWFFETWENGGSNWRRTQVTAYDCPRISREFLDEERAAMGSWWYRQEYECEFVDTVDSVFTYDEVQSAVDDGIQSLFGGGGTWATSS